MQNILNQKRRAHFARRAALRRPLRPPVAHRAVRRARPARCYDVLVHHNMGVDGDGSNFRSAWYHKYR